MTTFVIISPSLVNISFAAPLDVELCFYLC